MICQNPSVRYARRSILRVNSTHRWQRFPFLGDPPAYTSFATLIDPGAPAAMREDRRRHQSLLHEEMTKLAHEHGVSATSAIVEGRETQAILNFLREQKADLLVIGLHQHDFYVSRLWSSVYDVAQDAPCSVLGVH